MEGNSRSSEPENAMEIIQPGFRMMERYYVDDDMMIFLKNVDKLPRDANLKNHVKTGIRVLYETMQPLENVNWFGRRITYKRSPKNPHFGRVYAQQAGAFQAMPKFLRKRLLGPQDSPTFEIDIKSCCATMFRELAKKLDVQTPTVDSYCQNKTTFLEKVKTHFCFADGRALTNSDAKDLLISIFYGSGHNRFVEHSITKLLVDGDWVDISNDEGTWKRNEPTLLKLLRSEIRQTCQSWYMESTDFSFAGLTTMQVKEQFKELQNQPHQHTMTCVSYLFQHAEYLCLKEIHEQCYEREIPIICFIHDGAIVGSGTQDVLDVLCFSITDSIKAKYDWDVFLDTKSQEISEDEDQRFQTLLAQCKFPEDDGVDCELSLLCAEYGQRDVYKENLFGKEGMLVNSISRRVDNILSDPLNLPPTFIDCEQKHHILSTFQYMYVEVMKEFEIKKNEFKSCIIEDWQECAQEILNFMRDYSGDVPSVVEQFMASLKDDGDESSTRRKRKKPDTPSIFTVMAELKPFGFLPSRKFYLTEPEWKKIDYDVSYPTPRDNRLVHFPNMQRLFQLSKIPKLIYKYFRMNTDGNIYEVRLRPTYVYTMDPENKVDIVLEQALMTQSPLNPCVPRNFEIFKSAVLEDGSIAEKHSYKLSLLQFCDFRSDALVMTVGPRPHSQHDSGVLNTVKYPEYNHTLHSRMLDTLTHEVAHDVRILLDRLFCHIAGCKACHCHDCFNGGNGCHHCPGICTHSTAERENTRLCWQLKLWYSFMVKYPHVPIKKAVLMYSQRGGQGKTTIMTNLPDMLLGPDLSCTDKSEFYISGRFNSQVEGKRLLGVSEANFGNNQKLEQIFTGLIDSEYFLVEAKNRDMKRSDFYGAIMIASNFLNTFPTVTTEARKYFGFWCADKMKRPGFEEEVLMPIHTKWLRKTGEARKDLIFEIMSYFAQVDPEIEHKFLPDTVVSESPLLSRLAGMTQLAKKEEEWVNEFITPLISFLEKERLKEIVIVLNAGTCKMLGDVLKLTKTGEEMKELLRIRNWGTLTRSEYTQDKQYYVDIKPVLTNDDNEIDWPFPLRFLQFQTTTQFKMPQLHITKKQAKEGYLNWKTYNDELTPSHLIV